MSRHTISIKLLPHSIISPLPPYFQASDCNVKTVASYDKGRWCGIIEWHRRRTPFLNPNMKFLKLSGIQHPLIGQNELILAPPHVSYSALAFTFFVFCSLLYFHLFPPYHTSPYSFFLSLIPLFSLSSFCFLLFETNKTNQRSKTQGIKQSCNANIKNVYRDRVFAILIRLRGYTTEKLSFNFRQGTRFFSSPQSPNRQQGHPASYSIGNGGPFSGE